MSNRHYVHARDNAPSYLDTLRRIGQYAYKEKWDTVVGVFEHDISKLVAECNECNIRILNIKPKGRFFEYTIDVPFHNYRPNACSSTYEIDKMDDIHEFFRAAI
jgi:hypothetical protein